ncbi:hypothetical protein ACFYVL_20565 [Streptomyces sp. NPDC004111]|uniref:hypothetical protein n=1 Tax=Streptomyces sp. NPDC004111 TaxID=3364690 RepID=UPI0036807701
MDVLIPFLIMTGCFGAVLGLFAWLAVLVRRRGLAGGAMSGALASYEEAFRVTSHEAHVEVRAQAERKAPLLSPDDHWGTGPLCTGAAGARGRRPVRRPGRSRRGLGRWVERLRAGR